MSWIKSVWLGLGALGAAGVIVGAMSPAAAPVSHPASSSRKFEIFKTIAACQLRRELVENGRDRADGLALDAQAACSDGANRLADLGAPEDCSRELMVRGVGFLHISDSIERHTPGAMGDAYLAFDRADRLDHSCTDELNAQS